RHHPLDDRVTPGHDAQHEVVCELGSRVAFAHRDFGERSDDVDDGRRARHDVKTRYLRPYARAQRVEELALALLDPLARGENLLLVLLERRRHEALAVRDRLTSLKVRWHEMQIRLRDFDVVTKN